jgi:CRP-like cAMP-binding protein
LRRSIEFYVDFRTAPTDVIDAVRSALHGSPIAGVAGHPPPNVLFFGIRDSFAVYLARYWLTDLSADDGTDSLVRIRVYFALQRAGIAMSIPATAVFLTQESSEREARKNSDEHARRLQALRSIDLFEDLDAADRDWLADEMRFAPFTRGEPMTRQGEEDDSLFIIVSGEATVRVTAGLAEREVARLSAGSFFGEMSLMTGERRSATVIADSDVVCYRLGRAAFQTLLLRQPQFAERVAELLARRRLELETARENLDATTRARRMETDRMDLLGRIRGFFGLSSGDD